jgi:hypothetical protein
MINKHLAFIIAALMTIVSASCSARTGVPSVIQKFIASTFPSAQIVKVEREHKGYGVEYDVTLNDGTEIDFDVNKKWEQIDCKKSSAYVPSSVIPKAIAKHLAVVCPGEQVIEIERERTGYEVMLENGLEFKYDANGKYLRAKSHH